MRLRDLARDRVVWLYSAIVLGYFYVPLTTGTFYFRDLYRMYYPKRVFLAEAFRSGQFPLWDPTTHGGAPFLALPTNLGFHPSNVLYAFLPVVFAFNLVLVLHVLFCAVAAYWFARVLELSIPAAFVAGIAFAFCGYTLSTANLMQLLLALPWVPLTLGLTHRALRESRSLIPAAIAAAMPLYCAAAELTGMLFATLLVWVLTQRAYTRRAGIPAVLFVIAGGVGLSLLQTLPATSVLAQSLRAQGRSYESFTDWSVAPQRLPELAIPRFLGDTDSMREERRFGRSIEYNGYPYVISIYLGAPLLLLAIFGVRRQPVLAAVVAAAVLLSLGRNLPGFRLIYDYVPFVSIFRYPVKAQLAALIPCAILAACGIDVLAASATARKRARIAAMAVAIGAGAIAALLFGNAAFAESFARAFSFERLGAEGQTLLAGSFVHAALAAAAFAAAVASRRQVALAAVVAIDLLVAGRSVTDFAPRDIYEPSQLVTAARQLVGDGRFHSAPRPLLVHAPDDDLMWLARWQIESLNSYQSALFGMPAVYHDDYDGLAPARMARLGDRMPRVPWDRKKLLFDRANVRAFLTPVPVDAPQVAMIPTPGQPLRLYAHPTGVPARFVSSVVLASGERDAARRLLGERDLSRVVLEEQPRALGNCGMVPVARTAQTLQSRRYEVQAPCDGYVVIGENHYDGWSATLDGQPAKLVRADFAFTAVAVPRGRHVIEMRYFPPRLYAGALGVLATAILLVLLDRRRLRRRVTS
ncbi:MAG TPA: YfhO family protein [Thermoanaerobaculia bacterium]|nr:YfhO family protein [Thermoanaerobaculia bacterium]